MRIIIVNFIFVRTKIVIVFISIFLFQKGFSQTEFPPCEAFDTLGKDTIRAYNSYSNSLYAGVDNYIAINPATVPFKKLIIECPGGMVMDDEPNYLIIPSRPGTVKISIYQYDHGDTVLFFEKKMNVKPIPTPYITFDGSRLTSYPFISKNKLLKVRRFEVHVSEDFINDNDWYRIKEITVGYPIGNLYKSKTCEGEILSNEMVAELAKLPSGKEVTFSYTIAADGDFIKRIAPIRIKIF